MKDPFHKRVSAIWIPLLMEHFVFIIFINFKYDTTIISASGKLRLYSAHSYPNAYARAV